MRLLEITYLLLNLPLLAWCVLNLAIPWWGRILPTISLVVLVAGIALEGARWTMLPAFAVTCWLLIACTWPRLAPPGRWSGLAMLGLPLTTGVLTNLLPVFDLPRPTGNYRIGTITRHLIDNDRRELNGDRQGGPRELMIQVWYPPGKTVLANPIGLARKSPGRSSIWHW